MALDPSEMAVALRGALEAAEAALSAGDPHAAERATQRGVQVCEKLRDRGGWLEAEEAAAALALHGRLLLRAAAMRDELGQCLRRAGRSRLASAAYGRR